MSVIDEQGRSFKSLRVSLTNTCNLACVYCASSVKQEPHKKRVLEYGEIACAIQKIHELTNLKTIRLTGGEPTLYKYLIPLVKKINFPGVDLKMTSNGSLLENLLPELYENGLKKINISLDATNQASFNKISNRKNLDKILKTIDKAVVQGMIIKINTVVMKGFNEDQILPLFQFSKERNIVIRFLELMRMGPLYNAGDYKNYFFPEEKILETISSFYKFKPHPREKSSTANYWMTEDGYKFGIIANESSPFCHDCNRLRLDSYGNIFGCLSNEIGISIADCVNDPIWLKEKLTLALSYKQKIKFSGSQLSMMAVGG